MGAVAYFRDRSGPLASLSDVAGINGSCSIAAGLMVAAVPAIRRELVTGRPLVPASSPAAVMTAAGEAARTNGSSSYLGCDIPQRSVPAFTIMWLGKPSGTAGLDTRAFTLASASSNNPLAMINVSATAASKMRTFWRDDAGNFPASLPDSNGTAFESGRLHMLALRVPVIGGSNTGQATAFIDGIEDVTSSAYTVSTLTVDRVGIGCLYRASAGSFFAGDSVVGFFWARALSDAEILSVTRNPWQLLSRARIWAPVSAAAGQTISCGVGSAAAAGHPAAIAVHTAITCNVGSASAQGHAVAIEPHTVIAAGVGSGAAAGLAADISTTTTIAAGQAPAAGAGHQATITIGSGTTIPCGAGAGVAAGLPAAVSAGTGIGCSTGMGSAAGQPVGIAPHLVIAGGVAQATADGMQAGIVLRLSVACTTGEATAAGLPASIAIGADVPTTALPRYTLAAKPRRLELRARARRLEIGR